MQNRILVGLGVAAIVLASLVVYRSCGSQGIKVERHAAEEIRKAKQR